MTAAATTINYQEFCTKVFDAYNSMDVEALKELLTDDVVFTDPAGTAVGKDAVAAKEKEFWDAFPDCTWHQDGLMVSLDDPDTLAVSWTLSGTNTAPMGGMPATGKKVTLTGVNVAKLTDGLISELTFYFDSYSWFEQMGLLPKSQGLSLQALMLAEFGATKIKDAAGKTKEAMHL